MDADEQWAAEHNEALVATGMVEPMGDEEQSGAQLSVNEQEQDGVSIDDEANPGFSNSDDDDE